MCGIAGLLGGDRSALPALLKGVRVRGPDHLGSAGVGPFAAGAARLRLVGDARGDQPLADAGGRLLVANGECFNHADFGTRAEGESDFAPLHRADWSEPGRLLRRVRGPFALARFDPETGLLWLARDRHGVRPLFVAEARGELAFASHPAPLAAWRGTSAADEMAWDHLLAFQFLPPERSVFDGVAAVPPGEAWGYRLDGDQVRRVQRVAFADTEGRGPGRDGAGGGEAASPELLAALRAEAERAFALQARYADDVGLTLSGGLDSSAVLASLLKAGVQPKVAAVGWFPEGPSALDERPFARAAAAAAGVPLLEVPITAEAYAAAWDDTLLALGGPVAGPGSVSQWVVARALAAEGCRVVYSGQGGDELFGGYERHRLLLARDLGQPTTPRPGYETLLDGRTPPAEKLLFRGRELVDALAPERRARVLALRRTLPAEGPDLAERLLAFERRVLLPGLLAVDDATLAGQGMEGRVPFLDPEFAGAVVQQPLAAKSPPDAPRRLFLELFGARLPEMVRGRRDKMGFPLPLDRWFHGPFAAMLADSGLADGLLELGFEDRTLLKRPDLAPRTRFFLCSAARAQRLFHQTEAARTAAFPPPTC